MNAGSFIIGVAGGTGSGKTTVTEAIIRSLNNQDIIVIQHDSYYRDNSHLTPSKREKINYDHPDALETALLVKHLKQLKSGKKTEIPVYDFSTQREDLGSNLNYTFYKSINSRLASGQALKLKPEGMKKSGRNGIGINIMDG